MCGFAGIINKQNQPLDLRSLQNMIDVQRHRGPDDQGLAAFNVFDDTGQNAILADPTDDQARSFSAGVGFNRLAIQDLSEAGHQPMLSWCKEVMLTFNGEIYNAAEARDELIAEGYTFVGGSDTEVVLALYMRDGLQATLARLNGMFALAIVDTRLSRVFLARDPFGIKPFYYYKTDELFLFASEVKSFREHPLFRAELDQNHLDETLLFRSCSDTRTLFKEVAQVAPGTYVEISASSFEVNDYYQFNTSEECLDATSAGQKLAIKMADAVKSQLVSDVKVGCQLSGGIDSSLVTLLSRKQFTANMDTFSIVFDDPSLSEESYVNYVSNLTKADSHRFQFDEDYFIDNLKSATWHLDQPLGVPNTLGIKMLAERSKPISTVLLSGEGADELFGGYSRYHDLAVRRTILESPILRKAAMASGRIKRRYMLDRTDEEFFILSSCAIDLASFSALRPSASLGKTLDLRLEMFPKAGNFIKRASMYDMRTYLVDLLNRQDKMMMAHSVENRVPFLDKNLVDFVFSLPSKLNVKNKLPVYKFTKPGSNTKQLVKRFACKEFSADFVYRPKSGFPLPLAKIFAAPRMVEMMNDQILPSVRERGVFNSAAVDSIWGNGKKQLSGKDVKAVWSVMAFELWAQLFLDKAA